MADKSSTIKLTDGTVVSAPKGIDDLAALFSVVVDEPTPFIEVTDPKNPNETYLINVHEIVFAKGPK